MKTLSDYRTLTRVLLGDPAGRRYSDETVDMGLLEALSEWGRRLPGEWTIEDLDGASETTVADEDAVILGKGAAGYSMGIRARSVTEVFGKRPEDTERLFDQADRLRADFESAAADRSRRMAAREDAWPEKGWPDRGLR